ncbi:MAG: TatD family hydrolase [Caldicoprobacterales bacterium]|jgi:TatD DNase family protein|nr:TatD family hydrolase [Clostridiales bacterium]
MLFDTHAHLDDKRFDEDRDELIRELPNRGVSRVITPGIDTDSSKKCVDLAGKYDIVYAAVGIHPHEANQAEDNYLDLLADMARHKKVVAIGEIGLDYYYDFSPRDIQKKCFIEQIELAAELKLPIIIHNRDSHEDMLNILKSYKGIINGGVMHCFSGSWEMAKTVLDLGLYISLAGPVTFKNAKRPVEIAQNVPLDRLLIETDSPYLTPVPHRGKRNDPGHVSLVAEKIAEIRGITGEEVGRITTENAVKLFKIDSIAVTLV